MYKIYTLRSRKCEKQYIGCTGQSLTKRYSDHKSAFNTGQEEIKLYGKIRELDLTIDDFDIFELAIIEDREKAYSFETQMIKMLKDIGSGVFNEKKPFSKERLKKMSESQKGRKLTPEHRAKLSAAKMGNKNAKGHKVSDEQRKKHSEFMSGSVPPNKGEKGMQGANSGSFKKGDIPWNKKEKL